jgi:hypothetical protein
MIKNGSWKTNWLSIYTFGSLLNPEASFKTKWACPLGESLPLGVNLPPPRSELCILGGMFTPLITPLFTPLFTPRGEHSLKYRKTVGRIEVHRPEGITSPLDLWANFTPWGQLRPWGTTSPGGQSSPLGEIKNRPLGGQYQPWGHITPVGAK